MQFKNVSMISKTVKSPTLNCTLGAQITAVSWLWGCRVTAFSCKMLRKRVRVEAVWESGATAARRNFSFHVQSFHINRLC
jgi:hypothetical protein